MNKVIERKIYKLLARQLSISDFEKWLYNDQELEQEIDSKDYLRLISIDYHQQTALDEAVVILKPYINVGGYYEWILRWVLQKIIDRPPDVHLYIQQCYEMYCNGYDFLQSIGIDYGLKISSPPSLDLEDGGWESLSPVMQTKILNSFYPTIEKKAAEVLGWLDTGKIILTGYDELNMPPIQYIDNRSKEKEVL